MPETLSLRRSPMPTNHNQVPRRLARNQSHPFSCPNSAGEFLPSKLQIFSYIPNQWTGVFSGMKKPLLFAFALIVVGCGPPDGPHEEYYPAGQLSWKGTCKDGELDGGQE